MDSYCIVGSGPAGIAAAVALVDKGAQVTMIDAGFELEQDRAEQIKQLYGLSKDLWPADIIEAIKSSMRAHSGGVDCKTIYGSDFCYRGMDEIQPIVLKQAKLYRTLAKGGLSNVWGAAIFPFRREDINDWPIDPSALNDGYADVLNFMVHSGSRIRSKSIYPKYSENYQPIKMCRQIKSLTSDMERYGRKLNSKGVFYEQSRLAVDFSRCQYTGNCLYGCPHHLIYNSNHTLTQLTKRKNFCYKSGYLVDRVTESDGKVSIHGVHLEKVKKFGLTAKKVFLAAGVLSTARILLRSMKIYDKPISLKHSEHFQIPLMRLKKMPHVDQEDLHTLTQLSISLIDSSVCSRTVHLQVYAYNELYDNVMSSLLSPLRKLSKPIKDEILGRLLILKGYLHSDYSSRIEVSLNQQGNLFCQGVPNPIAKKVMRRIYHKLIEISPLIKSLPSPLMAHIGLPGEGNHSGGSFPMAIDPREFETDILGRPFKLKHVHVVDASVMPSIPASTITLTAMANAHRIASGAISTH